MACRSGRDVDSEVIDELSNPSFIARNARGGLGSENGFSAMNRVVLNGVHALGECGFSQAQIGVQAT